MNNLNLFERIKVILVSLGEVLVSLLIPVVKWSGTVQTTGVLMVVQMVLPRQIVLMIKVLFLSMLHLLTNGSHLIHPTHLPLCLLVMNLWDLDSQLTT